MKKTLGICNTVYNNGMEIIPDYEINELFQEGKKLYDEVILINPLKVDYIFGGIYGCPEIRYENLLLNNLTTLLVRNTRMNETAIALLANTLYSCECDIIDPINRFTGAPAGKLLQLVKGNYRCF